jgi:LacI family transcriptional regulator
MTEKKTVKRSLRKVTTLKDIARITGYSVNTVSRALRDKDDISSETKEKIKKVSLKTGYINNALASSLRLGHTNTIAVILGDISNPFLAIQMKEIEDRAREEGYSSFLINTNENTRLEREAIQMALNKNVDGILICPSQHNEDNIRYLMKTGLPFVQINRFFQNVPAVYVKANDEMGGYQAARYLIENGHRDILLLNGPSYISSARERLAGYKRALNEAGFPVRDDLIREVPITSGGCATVISDILRERIPFTAILAFSDILAWDAWTCLHRHGYSVPRDYSLMGFDNIQARMIMPFRLTTIGLVKNELTKIAVEGLIRIMRGELASCDTDGNPWCEIVDTCLVKGETVRVPGY